MKPNHIDHIGIAVKSLEESIPYYESLLETTCYAIEEVSDQFVKTAFFKVGETKIELLESTDPDGPIASYLSKNGEGIHHIAFAVDNTDQALLDAKVKGFKLIDRVSRIGAENMNIGFLNPKSTKGMLIEFCSKALNDL
jgi:methylmalonyl-CoA/ethylmalonyl-CoA epimerase